MTPTPSPQPRKLTLEDLDTFLALPALDTTLSPYCDAASVLASFDPLALRSIDGESATSGDVLERLRPLCEIAAESVEASRWTLTVGERRSALKRLGTRARMRHALTANPSHDDTALQRALVRVLDSAPVVLEVLSRDDLASLLTVLGWLEGILDGLPDPAVIKKLIRRHDLLAPMRRLTAAGLVGRDQELALLDRFVAGPPPQAPLFVHGPGGVGKSTLLARFVLQQVESHDRAVAYLDIDRPTIRPEHPATLLLDALGQLQPQLDAPVSHVESVTKELEYALSRHEMGRQLESVTTAGDWTTGLFADALGKWAAGRTVLLIVDTFEEVQFLGRDVTEPFAWFTLELQRRAPAARVILSGRTLPIEFVGLAFPQVMAARGAAGEPLPVEMVPEPGRPIALDVLDDASARRLLRVSLESAGISAPSDADLDDVIHVVSRNPMCLKLAARLLRDEGVAALGDDRTALLTKLRAEKIQALLYGRILRHLHGDDVRKVAYPGLVARRIDAGVVEKVLAEPCGLTFDDQRTPATIVAELAREAALVEVDPSDGSLRHRPDVRRTMLEDLTDHVDPSIVERINRNAVAYYQAGDGAVSRGEEIYHRLQLRQPMATIAERWTEAAGQRLKGALDELPPEQRLWLAERLGVTLDESVRQSADQAAWEAQAARTVNRYLQSRNPASALAVLHERDDRLPRSALFGLEAEVYRFMGQPDEALAAARRGVEASTGAGAIDLAFELLLKMVVIDEGRKNLTGAVKTLEEAMAVGRHSGNRLLRFRAMITALRLRRQIDPDDSERRAQLQREAQAALDEETLRSLREQPVLLREAAAELATDDPRLAAAAIETLGIEVSTDAQAETFARAVAEAVRQMTLSRGSMLGTAIEVAKQSKIDADLVRKWATEALTSRDTRQLGTELLTKVAGDEVLRGFRDYFRAGVDHALTVDAAKLRTK